MRCWPAHARHFPAAAGVPGRAAPALRRLRHGGRVSAGALARLVWLHLPAAAWGAAIEFTGWVCPLTPLENHLRNLGGGGVYRGGFVERYLPPVLYPENLALPTQQVLGGVVVGVNLVAYALACRALRRKRGG